MSEEDAKKEVVEEPEEKEATDPVEALAKEIGWNPDYDGEGAKTAAEFIRDGRAIQDTSSKQVKSLKRQVESFERGLSALKEHNETVFKVQNAQLRQELAQLKSRRKEAKEVDDDALVADLSEQIKVLEDAPKELPKQKQTQLPDEFIDWVDENEWYESDDKMKLFADTLAETPEYKALATADYARFLNKVSATTKKEFPDKFKAPSRPSAPAVESASRGRSTAKAKYTMRDLTPDQQRIAKDFEAMGVMKKEKYIQELADSGQLA